MSKTGDWGLGTGDWGLGTGGDGVKISPTQNSKLSTLRQAQGEASLPPHLPTSSSP